MLIWLSTIILSLIMLGGWLFLKRNPQKYIHEKKSPMNVFFRFGRFWHHIFKVMIIAVFMMLIFDFYKYLLQASNIFSIAIALISGVALTGGKELLDKKITPDDVIASIAGILTGLFVIYSTLLT